MASALLCFLVASAAVWVALSVPVMMPAAAAHGQAGKHCPPTACGNVNISFPFGLAPEDGALKNSCGRIGFQVRCRNNSAPYLGVFQSECDMQILRIFYDNGSLLIAKTSKAGFFNTSGNNSCLIPTANTSAELGPPFSIIPMNQKLIFYNCTNPVSHPDEGLVETTCRNNTYVRVAARRSDNKLMSGYFLDGCDAAVVPVLGRPGNMTNASSYEELLRDGFLVTWQQRPSPSGNFNLVVV
ncbi:hypothetical protein HU200_055408 [Digitaria exilis]|uniref:Wall-associated receptor kinase galacturonan-binding domain-containing protein n=1 Tax=Digitaria exilis TaxID=1010633 RepID=A0A835AGE9_9POAL|nr:hypothetical protein HU200_055408 [Digitaria exilis]CAB3472306.1 unnamed protein product [Digitaria exilis]